MGIATHWKVFVSPPDAGRGHIWIEDFREAQRARWDEIEYLLRIQDWTEVEAGILDHGGDEDCVRLIRDCLHGEEVDDWYSINDEVFNVAYRTLTDLGVRVRLEPLTISAENLNRLLRVHSQHLSEETLIEVIAIKTAAG
jgi:hypothetical protein